MNLRKLLRSTLLTNSNLAISRWGDRTENGRCNSPNDLLLGEISNKWLGQ